MDEDEEFITKKENQQPDFYKDCKVIEGNAIDKNGEDCFTDRCRPANGPVLKRDNPASLFYPGYLADEKKPRKVKKPKTRSNKKQQYQYDTYETTTAKYSNRVQQSHRHVRRASKSGPNFTIQTSNCRIIKSAKNDIRRRCDRVVETKSLDYIKAVTLFDAKVDLTSSDVNDFDFEEF